MTGPGRRTFAARHWPLFAALAAYWAAVAILTTLSVRANAGLLVYPLDDAYIHMAIAKNVALHHVWGVTRHAFSSSSSSLLWTALLAAVWRVFGIGDVLPLVLNVLFGTLLVVLSFRFLGDYVRQPWAIAALLAGVVFVTPLPTLTIMGMEHVLHALLSVAFVRMSIRVLRAGDGAPRSVSMSLAAVAALLTGARYEGFFLIAVVGTIFVWQRRYASSLAVAAAGALPAVAYGAWSMANGWWFLPNSVLLKGQRPSLSAWGIIDWVALALKKLALGQVLAILIAALFALALFRQDDEEPVASVRMASLILAGGITLHALFASAGAFYRYEAYLVLLGVLVLGASAAAMAIGNATAPVGRARAASAAALALLLLASFGQRALTSLRETVTATTNIYQQQYQMGLFLQRFYDGRAIVANDIGAISYLADIHLVDAWGLGSMEPAREKLRGTYGPRSIFEFVRSGDGAIAILYDDWFRRFGGLPPEWQLAGRWTIPNNIVCGGDTVSFYAFDPSGAADLKANLEQFARDLPRDVRQDGPYVAAAR